MPRPAFYSWHHHVPSARALSDAEVTEKVPRRPLGQQGDLQGAEDPRTELAAQGLHVGGKRVARLLVGRARPAPYPARHFRRPRGQAAQHCPARAFEPAATP